MKHVEISITRDLKGIKTILYDKIEYGKRLQISFHQHIKFFNLIPVLSNNI